MSDPFERAASRTESEYDRHRRERRRTGFRIHATAFVAVQVLLVMVWVLTDGDNPWFLYPLVGWGIGLAIHYAAVRDRLGGGKSSQPPRG